MSTKEMLELEKSRLQSDIIYEEKNLVLAYVLWFFFGMIGGHRFYLGKIKSGVTMLLLTVVGWVTSVILVGFLFLFVTGIWWLIDIYYTNKYVVEHNNAMKSKKLEILDKQIQEADQVVENTKSVEAVKEIKS
tara:strand:+ start:40918 stop:41316 length:399 start_codon:yes stop_codon:yes gene_type:complete